MRRRVLDIGCGQQPFRHLIESLGGEYSGLDVNQNSDNTVRFVVPFDEVIPTAVTEDGLYDVILCTEVLEHIANWPTAFENLRALMRRGGRVILTCPHSYQLHEEPHDFFRATDHAIRWHARRADLEPVRIERLGSGWDVLGGVMANLNPTARQTGLAHRAAARLIRITIKRVIFPLLRTRWMHRTLHAGGPLYLANAAILAKTR